jgi:hypothetical protein
MTDSTGPHCAPAPEPAPPEPPLNPGGDSPVPGSDRPDSTDGDDNGGPYVPV